MNVPSPDLLKMTANGFDDGRRFVVQFNSTPNPSPPPPPQSEQNTVSIVVTMVVYVLMISITTIGNLTVIVAIGLVKKLKTPSNTLVMNLALSDFLVGTIVMPLALLNGAFGGKWILGPYLCNFWTTMDVLVCTASILNFLAISVDRYLIIAHPLTYSRKRTFRLMLVFIATVWLLSIIISTSPMFGWGLPSTNLPSCIVNQSLSYQIFATLLSFYLPLSLVIILYVHIFRIANKTAKRERDSLAETYAAYYAIKEPFNNGGEDGDDHEMYEFQSKGNEYNEESLEPNDGDPAASTANTTPPKTQITYMLPFFKHRKNTRKQSRRSFATRWRTIGYNQKAIITLGVVLGCFCICWLPFFINALLKPTYKHVRGYDMNSPEWLDPFLLWLGYLSPLLNPIIYSIFNREFRRPFKEVLLCRCKGLNTRMNRYAYSRQIG